MTREQARKSFVACLVITLNNADLVQEFNRLQARKLGQRTRTPIEIAIDEATGYAKEIAKADDDDMAAFVEFVKDCVWSRMPEADLIAIAEGVLV